ncbi:MAG: KaiC domain-containing protein [Halanaeroarchaeum sp.]
MVDEDPDDEEDWFERAVDEESDAEDGASPPRESVDRRDERDEREDDPDRESSPPPDATGTGTTDERDRTGETDAEVENFGFGGDPGDAGTFGSDFSEAFDEGEGPPGETFGFDVDDPSETPEGGEFDGAETTFDEDFESDIPRIELGIEGLDEMIRGGVPERSLIVAVGGAGTGKTTFGIQFLAEALENDERGVFITLEESHDRILQSAEEKGWAFERHESEGDLAIIDLDPVEMANSLANIRDELPALVERFGASRLVLDSVSLLEMMYDDQATRRTEIYDFTRSLKEAGVTTMLTSEAAAKSDFASRYGIIEYLTDAVFVLRHVRPEDFRETRLAIEIQKIRDANHSRETKPYEITDDGISVYRQANIF